MTETLGPDEGSHTAHERIVEEARKLERMPNQRMLRSVAERSDEVAVDRAVIEEIHGRLEVDENSLRSDLAALNVERDELGQELARARERLASLDAAIDAERLHERAKANELEAARHRLARARDLVGRLEQEIREYRGQMAIARERLADLVESALRLQHRLWLANDKTV